MWFWFLGGEDPLEKKMATHSSILAWRIPWTEEPSGLQSTGSQRDMTELLHNSWAFVQPHALGTSVSPPFSLLSPISTGSEDLFPFFLIHTSIPSPFPPNTDFCKSKQKGTSGWGRFGTVIRFYFLDLLWIRRQFLCSSIYFLPVWIVFSVHILLSKPQTF